MRRDDIIRPHLPKGQTQRTPIIISAKRFYTDHYGAKIIFKSLTFLERYLFNMVKVHYNDLTLNTPKTLVFHTFVLAVMHTMSACEILTL